MGKSTPDLEKWLNSSSWTITTLLATAQQGGDLRVSSRTASTVFPNVTLCFPCRISKMQVHAFEARVYQTAVGFLTEASHLLHVPSFPYANVDNVKQLEPISTWKYW